MPTQLTIVIPFLNEGEEVANTVASIRATAVTDPCITLINDASADGYDYEGVAETYGCRYVKNSERLGVAASRNLGVRESQAPHFLLLDGHMRFYENGWDERLVKLLGENPRSVLCGQTKWLDKEEDGSVTLKEIPTPYGAYIRTTPSDTLNACRSMVDMTPYGNLSEIVV
jgi:glycosyltransferase involved in cell wall biosynthesis